MSVPVPATIWQWALDGAAGDPNIAMALVAVAHEESGWNEKALGDYGIGVPAGTPSSFGLLQYHRPGGLGDPYTPAQLLDGPTIMRLGGSYLRGRLAQGAGLYDALQPWSTRPQAWALYQRLLVEGVQVDGAVPPTATPAAAVPAGSALQRPTLPRAALLVGLFGLAVLVLGDS